MCTPLTHVDGVPFLHLDPGRGELGASRREGRYTIYRTVLRMVIDKASRKRRVRTVRPRHEAAEDGL